MKKIKIMLFACMFLFAGIFCFTFIPISSSAEADNSITKNNVTITLTADKTSLKTTDIGETITITLTVENNTGEDMMGAQGTITVDTSVFEIGQLVKSTDISNSYKDASSKLDQGIICIAGDNSFQPISATKWVVGSYTLKVKSAAANTSSLALSKCEIVDYYNGNNLLDTSSTGQLDISFVAPSSECELTALTSTQSGVSITKNGTNFEATVPYTTTTLNTANLNPTVSAGATVAYSPSGNVALNEGQNNITITVTAEDGVTKKTSTLTVTRSAGETASTLSSLTLKNGSNTLLSKASAELVSGGTFTIDGKIDYADRGNITIETAKNGTYSTVQTQVDGKTISSTNLGALTSGEHTVTVTVTSQTGTSTQYTIKLTVDEAPAVVEKDTENRLASLTLTYLDGTAISLSPTFSSDVTSYTAKVSAETTKVKVNASALSGLAQVTYTEECDVPGTIQVKVTAENGAEKTYTITVTAEQSGNPSQPVGPSEPTNPGLGLNNLAVYAVLENGVEFPLSVSEAGTDRYKVTIPYGFATKAFVIKATSNDEEYVLQGVDVTFAISQGETLEHHVYFVKNGVAEKVVVFEITYDTNNQFNVLPYVIAFAVIEVDNILLFIIVFVMISHRKKKKKYEDE